MTEALVIGSRPFVIDWVNSSDGSTNVRGLLPLGATVGGTMISIPSLPVVSRMERGNGILHYKAAFDCSSPSVVSSLRAVPGFHGIMGIAFTYRNVGGFSGGGGGYLLAGVKLTADNLPPWANSLPTPMKNLLSNMAAATDSMRRMKLFAVIP